MFIYKKKEFVGAVCFIRKSMVGLGCILGLIISMLKMLVCTFDFGGRGEKSVIVRLLNLTKASSLV